MSASDEFKFKTSESLKILHEFRWLLNLYVLDFYVEDHWKKLPVSWRNVFDSMDPSDLGRLISGDRPKVVLPLSFLSLLSCVKTLSIVRKPSDQSLNYSYSSNIYTQDNPTKPVESNDTVDDLCYQCRTHPRLVNLFLKNVKKKKRHEISLMSEMVKRVAEDTGCSNVVDIGSGLGHLVRTLAYKHNLKTLGVEAQPKLTGGARELDNQFEYTALKHLNKKEALQDLKPEHINIMLTQESQKHLFPTIEKFTGHSWGLVGLHPCGDLGPLLLKIFSDNPQVKFICIVGCCYMKLSCGDSKSGGYPLSNFVSNLENNNLSYEGREIACHAIETYCERLRAGIYEDLQVHSFRAVLEKLLVSKWPHMKHIGLRSIKHHNTLTFHRYCEIATERLGVTVTLEDVSSKEVLEDLKKWKQVVIFYSLRLILAPLVESVILMDRVISLREKGAVCEIKPVFDPLTSPRNHILIGKKI